jgi:hypothetical protein
MCHIGAPYNHGYRVLGGGREAVKLAAINTPNPVSFTRDAVSGGSTAGHACLKQSLPSWPQSASEVISQGA